MLIELADEPVLWMTARHWIYATVPATIGLVFILLGILWRPRRRVPRCPKCRYDMRGGDGSLRCPECGHTVRDTEGFHRRRRLAPLLVLGLVTIAGYPGWRAVLWSKDRGWSPPLPTWRVFDSTPLGNGFVVERMTPRNRWNWGRACRIRWSGGRSRWFESDHSFSIGGPTPDGSNVGLGDDITGNGVGNLILMEWSGGAHCCYTYVIFELSPNDGPIEIAVIEAEHGGHFEDRDGDGLPEWVGCDWHWAYALDCFTCLDYPEIILRHDGTDYLLAGDLMCTAAPTPEEFDAMVVEIRDQDWSEYIPARSHLWSRMLELIYTGHAPLAWRLYDEARPSDVPRRQEDLDNFREVFESSPFAEAVRLMSQS
jgi:hypothetical protein